MKGFLTSDGFYYEADTALSMSDLEIPVRPDGEFRYDLATREWVADRSSIPRRPLPWPPYENHTNREAGMVDLSNLKLNLKDVIQASFAVISLVSVFFTVRGDIDRQAGEIDTLKRATAAYHQELQEHNVSETAHWRQFQAMEKRIAELERELAYYKRTTASRP